MLSSLVKDHQAKQAIKKEELGKSNKNISIWIGNSEKMHWTKTILTEHHRKEAVAASGELTQALVDHLNVG